MFDHVAILVFPGEDEDRVLEALLLADVDVTDLEMDEGRISVFVPHTEHFKAKTALEAEFGDIDFEVDEVQFLAQSGVSLTNDESEVMDKLVDTLDYLEDVQSIFHNVEASASA
jgi:transcriptional/translational regulatory protein YebC/TACO1